MVHGMHDHGISDNSFVDEQTVGIILTVTFPNSVQDIMYNTCTFRGDIFFSGK